MLIFFVFSVVGFFLALSVFVLVYWVLPVLWIVHF